MLHAIRKTMAGGELGQNELINLIFGDENFRRIFFISPVNYNRIRNIDPAIRPDITLVDSFTLVKILNAKWKMRINRYSFDNNSVASAVYSYANQNGMRIAIIGADERDNDKYCTTLTKLYPNINLVMKSHGYLNYKERKKVIRSIQDLGPDIIIVGMGSPAQEEFCSSLNLRAGQKAFTCGGHISQSARQWTYYPWLVNKMHVRWLYRLVKEPHTRRRLPCVIAGLVRAWREANA